MESKYKELRLYRVDMKYIRDLQNKDKRVYSVSPQSGKKNRPFLGLIVTCGGYSYCIPLTGAKDKYKNMSDRIDFTKVVIDGEVVAGINFSRMIPVTLKQLTKIDLRIKKHDSEDTVKRKKRLQKELDWYNAHRETIVNKANVLYFKYVSGEYFKRKVDCLNFPELEKVCDKNNEEIENPRKQ